MDMKQLDKLFGFISPKNYCYFLC